MTAEDMLDWLIFTALLLKKYMYLYDGYYNHELLFQPISHPKVFYNSAYMTLGQAYLWFYYEIK